MSTSQFTKVDFSNREIAESLARAYAVAIHIKQPVENIKESPGVTAIRGEPPKPPRKPKKKEQPPEQMRLF